MTYRPGGDACAGFVAYSAGTGASLDVIIEKEWKGSDLIIVEIRSLVAYNWLLNKDRRPWSQQTTFVDMERRLAYVGEAFSGVLTSAAKNAAIDSVANICSAFRNKRR
ncbi:hypothetical protein Golax_025501 [Gossypium laxum]|uniref:Uncharacterized protein n=1 Tax=Gossypium laxum TaxID=34288 RepID=A0A7J9B2U9_9ROSI|nr:hypothetical protein [Gossypium laxum]